MRDRIATDQSPPPPSLLHDEVVLARIARRQQGDAVILDDVRYKGRVVSVNVERVADECGGIRSTLGSMSVTSYP